MAVPMAILDAARLGDRETVVAWLDSPGANVNAVAHDGVSLLMVVGCRYGPDGPPPRDAETSLELDERHARRCSACEAWCSAAARCPARTTRS